MKCWFCNINLFDVHNGPVFFELLGKAVTNASRSKLENASNSLSKWVSNLTPKISLVQCPDQALGIKFYFTDQKSILAHRWIYQKK